MIADSSNKKYTIATDSKYSIDCVTKWADSWKKNGWKNSQGKPVQNKEVIQSILEKKDRLNQIYKNNNWGEVEFKHVKGHAGIHGNEMADQLANQGAAKSS
ncbi:unnamed protein product [Ambrosiozyma monospora]|uniref:Unnamed protein product n=1 Tax=Ambrosiozyma monospora TaxID=43982 RepID=A0ACB5TY08_AMBMO|nr:unnamed protein product [Ambrosiozyma monospora]